MPEGQKSERVAINEPSREIRATAEGRTPEHALADLGRILGAGGSRPPFGFGTQQRGIEQWGRERNLWLSWEEASAGASAGGIEHLIRPEPALGRIIKITRAPVFGRTGWLNNQGLPALVEATPLEYLIRWYLANKVLGDSARIVGVTAQKPGLPALIISQPLVKGAIPSRQRLRKFFSEAEFERVPGTHTFFRRSDGVALYDARPANLVERNGVCIPIDVIPVQANDRLRRALLRHLK